MENAIKMPAAYAVMSTEEMTYTDGGATALQALCAWFLPFYGWYKGITAVRDYRRANPDTWLDTGLQVFTDDMSQSTANLFYDLGTALCVISTSSSIIWLPINALIVFS